jgi:glycosyltransferase involved in cell wall biosynthesis
MTPSAESAGASRRTVALFSTHFVEYSQTFVYDEVRHHERYDVEVFCKKRMNTDRFPWAPVHEAGPLYGITRRDPGFSRAFASGRFALAHAHFGRGGVYALGFARRHRLPLVVTFHGYDVPILFSPARFEPRFFRYALYARSLFRSMTLGLCASRELYDMMVRLRVPEDRLRLHHIGIDLQRFVPAPVDREGPLDVVMIGRFVEKKGFEYGMRAFAAADPARTARLTLIGEGELEGRLRALAQELGIAERVRFTGVLTSAGVAEHLQRSDVLLAPSVVAHGGNRESGLLTVKEASACKVVPIGTLHGGIPEIIDDAVTGFLVPERDVSAMAARLRQLLAEPRLRATMGEAARAKMLREYDNRARVQALEGFYDEAIALRARRAAARSED